MSQFSPAVDVRSPYTTRTTCRLCGGQWLIQFLDLGNLHLSDFVLPGDPLPPKVPLRLAICSACNLVQLMETTDPELLYRKFWYKSGTNQTMYLEMERLAQMAVKLGKSGPGFTWLDIGANDGTLLRHAPPGTWRVGVEPALNLREPLLKWADQVHTDFFHAGLCDAVDVVFTAAMFYDLDDPVSFCEDIARTLKPGGVWINQLSYTPAMLEMLAFDNVCHEHLAYYTLETLERVYYRAGLEVRDVSLNAVNGGSMCVVGARRSDPRKVSESVSELRQTESVANYSLPAYTRFARGVSDWKRRATDLLDRLTELPNRPIHLYGASTKGNTLLQYLEATPDWFECASERNPDKWGRRTVGSNIPIVAEGESRLLKPSHYFVLPWAFRDEFIERENPYLKAGGKLIFPLPDLEIVG